MDEEIQSDGLPIPNPVPLQTPIESINESAKPQSHERSRQPPIQSAEEESSVPIESDVGGERTSAAEGEAAVVALGEEMLLGNENDEKVSILDEDLVERDEDEKVAAEISCSVVGEGEVMQERGEEKVSDVDGRDRRSVVKEEVEVGKLDEIMEKKNVKDKLTDVVWRPELAEFRDEKVKSLQDNLVVEEEEDACKLDEVMEDNVDKKMSDFDGESLEEGDLKGEALQESLVLKEELEAIEPDQVMEENVEEKVLDFVEERSQLAEGDDKVEALKQNLVVEEEVEVIKSDAVMEESVEKVLNFDGMHQVEQLNEEMPLHIEENLKGMLSGYDGEQQVEELKASLLAKKNVGVPLLQEEYVEEDQTITSEISVAENMLENVEQKPREEQMDEERSQSVGKEEQVSSSQQGPVEENEKLCSSQEGSADRYEKATLFQEESSLKENEEESDEKEDAEEMDMDDGGPAMAAGKRTAAKRKRGRPLVSQGRKPRTPSKPKEDESLCFICFDGGDLVICDHKGCPKVYHPSCVNRDEAYFKEKGHWSCGWHICSNCQKSAQYMCYTCTYSLCRGCTKVADFRCVRGNKGFCESCMKIVMLIETNTPADENMDVLDFDDKNSWMYLFKDYWVDLKAKLSLTIEELTAASNLLKEMNANSGNKKSSDIRKTSQCNEEPAENPEHVGDDQKEKSSRSSRRNKESTSSKKARKRSRNTTNKEHIVKEVGAEQISISDNIEWASKELLEFVARMKDGDISVLSQDKVQGLLLEYINQNNLRDPRRKSQIRCDSMLRSLFGKSRVGHFEMLKLLEPHFLIKEASPLATDDNQGGVEDPDLSQVDAEGISDASTKMTLDTRRKSRKRVEEKGPTNLGDFAAIDVHNVSLLYLRRNLMEEFLDDVNLFSENVIGSFVRIRISGSASNKDMYRLVQVVGTGKAAGNYVTGKKTTDITLEILNLNKREFITIDLISNQDFTEEECKRLRQSVKCGFIDRLTVSDVQEKARALQIVKVDDWLVSEKARLEHLRDRASEKGRIKEHRECVEKLQRLSTGEERIRRLNEVPEIHIDPNMDPNYDSTEDEDDQNCDRQGRGGFATWKNSHAAWPNRNVQRAGHLDVALPSLPPDGLSRNQGNDARPGSTPHTPKAEMNATGMNTGVLKNALPLIEPRHSCGIPIETVPQPQPARIITSSNSETEKIWHYQDPTGKIQGPFSMIQLRKWNTSGLFPPNLKIWRTSEKQEDSVLLTDALNGKFHEDLKLQEPHHSNSLQPTNAAATGSGMNNVAVGGRGSGISQIAGSLPSTGNYNLVKSDRWSTQPSSMSTANIGVAESSKNFGDRSSQAQVHNSPGPMTPFARNLSQPPTFQGRDGQGENNGRWNGSRGRQNNWNSNKPRRFNHNSRGYDRQHPYQSTSSQQFSGGNVRASNEPPNQLGGNSFSLPSHAPQTGSIDWASLQGAINNILPSAPSVQPVCFGPTANLPNLTSPAMNPVGTWASNSIPNVNPAKMQENAGISSNHPQQRTASETAPLVTAGDHPGNYAISSATEIVDGSNGRQKMENDNSNTTLNREQVSGNELVTNKKCTEAHNRSAFENKIVNSSAPAPSPAASNALGSSNLPDAADASNSRVQSESQCSAPAPAQQQVSNNLTVIAPQQQVPNNLPVNPAQPLNTSWGMIQQNPGQVPGIAQGFGHMVTQAMPGAGNMGWGMMAPGLMNMTWGTPANSNLGWGQAQATMNTNVGWAIPAQGNANGNLAWGAQAQPMPSAGWGMPMAVNAAVNPGWVAPGNGNPNLNPSWVAATAGNTNQNTHCGTTMQGTGQVIMNSAANQNGSGGKINSTGERSSSHPPPQAEQRGICPFHKTGHCKKGASCNMIHS